MYSFLSRHEQDLETSTGFGVGCGYLMYQAWGGKAGKAWAHNKLKELGLVEAEGEPSIPSSSYPGQVATTRKRNKSAEKYIHPALLNIKK